MDICSNFVRLSPYLDKFERILLKLGLQEDAELLNEFTCLMRLRPLVKKIEKLKGHFESESWAEFEDLNPELLSNVEEVYGSRDNIFGELCLQL